MSDQLTLFVESLEGTRLKAYRCPAGGWTVGTGHTSAAGAPVVTPNPVITQAQACEILARDLARVRAEVLRGRRRRDGEPPGPVAQDAWHHGAGFLSGRSLQTITYHRAFGEVSRAREAILDAQPEGIA